VALNRSVRESWNLVVRIAIVSSNSSQKRQPAARHDCTTRPSLLLNDELRAVWARSKVRSLAVARVIIASQLFARFIATPSVLLVQRSPNRRTRIVLIKLHGGRQRQRLLRRIRSSSIPLNLPVFQRRAKDAEEKRQQAAHQNYYIGVRLRAATNMMKPKRISSTV